MININVEEARKIIDGDKFMEGVVKYRYIMNKFNRCDVSQNIEFQCIFNDFYGMNMVKKEKFPMFLKRYYSFMEQNKNRTNVEFGEIIRYLFDKAGMITPSFSSKMLHTINKDMPIWDKHVLRNLGKEAPAYNKDRDINIKQNTALYDEIYKCYSKYLNGENSKEILGLFGEEYSDISDTKKIDFILWLTRGE